MTDVADYLGEKDGGWIPIGRGLRQARRQMDRHSRRRDRRVDQLSHRCDGKRPASRNFPKDLDGFPDLAKGLKKNGTPAGMALGHASGDANTWLHWALWSHGGNLVDANNKVVINSPETAKSLEYVKELYDTFIPGTASWNDSSNNKAFLAGQLL